MSLETKDRIVTWLRIGSASLVGAGIAAASFGLWTEAAFVWLTAYVVLRVSYGLFASVVHQRALNVQVSLQEAIKNGKEIRAEIDRRLAEIETVMKR